MKFCVDCRHWSPSNHVTDKQLQMEFSKCYHPEIVTYDLVSGKKIVQYARTMRAHNCGYDGVLWEAKSPEPQPVTVEVPDPPQNEGLIGINRNFRKMVESLI